MNYWQKFEYDNYYHVYNKTGTGIRLFKENNDYEIFLARFNRYLGQYLDVYAYVLMPNHFHLLIKVKDEQSIFTKACEEKTIKSGELLKNEIHVNDFIVDQFKRWLSSYTITYKNKYEHVGSVFMNKFKRIGSQSMERNIYWLAYIHHNPIHHKYCNDYGHWKYSSYNAYISPLPTKLSKDDVYTEWFSSMDDFLNYHKEFKFDKNVDIDLLADPNEDSSAI